MATSKTIRKRDANGRFVKGCAPGPGRPPAVREQQYLDSFRSVVTIEDWEMAVQSVVKRAKKGDLKAFEIIAKHALPLPAQRIDMHRKEESLEEFRIAGASGEELLNEMIGEILQHVDLVSTDTCRPS